MSTRAFELFPADKNVGIRVKIIDHAAYSRAIFKGKTGTAISNAALNNDTVAELAATDPIMAQSAPFGVPKYSFLVKFRARERERERTTR